jgi:polysaccharide export outer membrane protein
MTQRIISQLILLIASLVLYAQHVFAQDVMPEYVLGPGDIIRITVFQNPDLTTEARVSESGVITFPLVGGVKVGGLTVPSAEGAIAEQLRTGGFVLQPQVGILPLQIRGNQVAVLGHVNRPGRYPLETLDTRLSDMLATAGGISPTGADEVVLVGERGGQPLRVTVNIPQVFAAGDFSKDLRLAGGDRIYVQRAPMFYIYGQVNRPGAFRLEDGMTVMQGLATGGGITLRGTEKGVQIHRRDAEGALQVLEPGLSSVLRPDDVIYVRESLF